MLVVGVKRRFDSIIPPTAAGYEEFLRLARVASDEPYLTLTRAAQYWWNRRVPNNLLSAATAEEKAMRAAFQKARAEREQEEKLQAERLKREQFERERLEREERQRAVAERLEQERLERERQKRVEREERDKREREELDRNPHATLRLVSEQTANPSVRERLKSIGAWMGSKERVYGVTTWPWYVPLARASEARAIIGEE